MIHKAIKDTKRLKDFVKDADVLHFHYGSDMGIYYPFLKINKIPTVVSFYGYDCSSFPNIFFGFPKPNFLWFLVNLSQVSLLAMECV